MNESNTRMQENMLAQVSVDSSESGSSILDCGTVPPSDPCAVVILGATGDLTARKLIPSLFHMYRNDRLPESFAIIGSGRTQLNDEAFRNKLASDMESAGRVDRSAWTKFSKLIHYQPVGYEDLETFNALARKLKKLDHQHHTSGNRLFYLALPPNLYAPVAQMTGKSGLGIEKANGNGKHAGHRATFGNRTQSQNVFRGDRPRLHRGRPGSGQGGSQSDLPAP